VREGTVTQSGSIAQNWNADFTCAAGSMFDLDGVLPDGTFSISGGSNWTGNGQTYAFTVQTPTRLVHDADCSLDRTSLPGTCARWRWDNRVARSSKCSSGAADCNRLSP